MNVIEARRVRHLILRVDRGEEIPSALLRALDEAEARSGWIEGTGSLEAAEIALFDQPSKSYARSRRAFGPCDVVSLSGNVSILDGSGVLRLTATLAREGDLGLEVFAGELVWARAYAIELHVTVFDDATLVRAFDERTGLARLQLQEASASEPPPPRAAAARAFEEPRAIEPLRPQPSASHAVSAPSELAAGPALPARPNRPRDDVEVYPEVGDLVSHFHFGECSVLSSDGDRIRLRQERDGRVREVSLTMLRIEAPTTDAEGRRHFHLARKN